VLVNLGTAVNYVILAKSEISTVPSSLVTDDIGVSPISSTAITGFSLIWDGTGIFSTSSQVVGSVFAADYTPPNPGNLTTASATSRLRLPMQSADKHQRRQYDDATSAIGCRIRFLDEVTQSQDRVRAGLQHHATLADL